MIYRILNCLQNKLELRYIVAVLVSNTRNDRLFVLPHFITDYRGRPTSPHSLDIQYPILTKLDVLTGIPNPTPPPPPPWMDKVADFPIYCFYSIVPQYDCIYRTLRHESVSFQGVTQLTGGQTVMIPPGSTPLPILPLEGSSMNLVLSASFMSTMVHSLLPTQAINLGAASQQEVRW